MTEKKFCPLLRPLLRTDGESDGGSDTDDAIGVIGVVEDEVVIRFGANEAFMPEVVARASTDMQQRVRAGDGDRTTFKIACAEFVVEHDGRGAHSRGEIGSDSLVDARGIQAVEAVEDWAVPLKAVVQSLVIAERAFGIDTETVGEQDLDIRTGISPTPLGGRRVGFGGTDGHGGKRRAAAEADVYLLSLREAGGGKNQDAGIDK